MANDTYLTLYLCRVVLPRVLQSYPQLLIFKQKSQKGRIRSWQILLPSFGAQIAAHQTPRRFVAGASILKIQVLQNPTMGSVLSSVSFSPVDSWIGIGHWLSGSSCSLQNTVSSLGSTVISSRGMEIIYIELEVHCSRSIGPIS